MSPLTTHVLDTARGRPAVGVPLTLIAPDGTVTSGVTDADGRCRTLSTREAFVAGTWTLTFDLSTYFRDHGTDSFYPSATIVFAVRNPEEHHHVPLLLAPYGYSTYRGS
ncbi:MAG: hydroxyisourate hydrolase [Pseudomonadota bacterium]|nr:hydroxyisourate hydrolase [Pseudomonadota bacterium]